MMGYLSLTGLSVISSLILITYKLIVEPLFISPLSRIPSAHPSSHISPFWIYYIRYTNIENRTLYELHTKKGPILRLAPNELSINCYEQGLKTVYTGGFEKTDFYFRRFHNYDGVTNLFSMKDHRSHAQRKRILSNVYSKSQVFSSPTTRETTKAILYDRLLPIFQNSVANQTSIELLSLSYAYSMDSFMAYQFGLSLASNFIQDVVARDWYLKNFFSPRPWLFWTVEVPNFTRFVEKLGIQLVPKWSIQSGKDIQNWSLDICDKAEQLLSKDEPPAAIDVPVIFTQQRAGMRKQDLDPKSQNDFNLLTIEQPYPRRLEIASDMHCHSAAALETSGDTLTYVYYELSRRPTLQAQLRKELLTLDPPIIYPLPEGQTPELPDPKILDSLPILDAVLQETLRIWAATPGAQPRVTPFPSCTLAGYTGIPGGVHVQASSYAIHRNPDAFPGPEEWKHERWLEAEAEQLTEMRHWFWAWGSGGRMCIGSNIAIHTMKLAIASIYTNFTSTIVDADGIEQDEGFTAGPRGQKLVLQYQRA
ncbi:cytochrome P450 [Bisporella sp. PMI_857]|nr:cytochrome P450 [Bisporella sp. PMI_857]